MPVAQTSQSLKRRLLVNPACTQVFFWSTRSVKKKVISPQNVLARACMVREANKALHWKSGVVGKMKVPRPRQKKAPDPWHDPDHSKSKSHLKCCGNREKAWPEYNHIPRHITTFKLSIWLNRNDKYCAVIGWRVCNSSDRKTKCRSDICSSHWSFNFYPGAVKMSQGLNVFIISRTPLTTHDAREANVIASLGAADEGTPVFWSLCQPREHNSGAVRTQNHVSSGKKLWFVRGTPCYFCWDSRGSDINWQMQTVFEITRSGVVLVRFMTCRSWLYHHY